MDFQKWRLINLFKILSDLHSAKERLYAPTNYHMNNLSTDVPVHDHIRVPSSGCNYWIMLILGTWLGVTTVGCIGVRGCFAGVGLLRDVFGGFTARCRVNCE